MQKPFELNWVGSPHCDERPDENDISLLVIHNISLPPGEYGNCAIRTFFQGNLDTTQHPFFESIGSMRVSAHAVIYRSGIIEQFVDFKRRAWHAGVSSFQGRHRCNDYSIGIELEGTDSDAYTDEQYTALRGLCKDLMTQFPAITLGRIVGHNDIAPGRKTDPGISFNWARFRQSLVSVV